MGFRGGNTCCLFVTAIFSEKEKISRDLWFNFIPVYAFMMSKMFCVFCLSELLIRLGGITYKSKFTYYSAFDCFDKLL